MRLIFFFCLALAWYANASIVSNCSIATALTTTKGKVYCGPTTVVITTSVKNQANVTTITNLTTAGTPTCAQVCSKGYSANGSSSVDCVNNVTDTSVFGTCTDINECANTNVSNCGNATCFNTPGSFSCICNHGKAFNKTSRLCLKYSCAKKSTCGTIQSSMNLTYFLQTFRLDSLNATLINISGVAGSQMSLAVVTINSSYASTEIQITIKAATTGGKDPQVAWYKISDALKDPNSSLVKGFPDISHFSQLNAPDTQYFTHYNALWGLLPIFLFALLCACWRPLVALWKGQTQKQKDFDEESAQPVLDKEEPSEPSALTDGRQS